MSNLQQLIKRFNLKRTFSCSHTKVEVDGIMVKTKSDDEEDTWIPIIHPDQGQLVLENYHDREVVTGGFIPSTTDQVPTHFAVAVEELLQDPAVIRSARVSTGRDTIAVDEKAQGMMNYLWRDAHVTPYESGVVMRLRMETPIPYADPLFRLFASFNEFSGRYSNIDTGYYTPGNISEEARREFEANAVESDSLYRELLAMDVAKEMARLCLCYRYFTKFYMTISLRHIMEFLSIKNLTNRHLSTEFWEIKNLFESVLENWTPWANNARNLHSREIDFQWVKEFTEKHKGKNSPPYLSEVKLLNHGVVRLIEVSGDTTVMLGCLDDFPNPLRGFGHGHITFFARVPIHVFRQWVRHRYGAITQLTPNYDHIVSEDLFFIPDKFRKQTGKVGHYTFVDMTEEENKIVRTKMMEHKNRQRERYWRLVEMGVSSEIAMMVLPTCFYIPIIVTKPIESIFNFTSLRLDSHAQYEIRQYASVVWEMFSRAFPEIARLFAKHIYYGDSKIVKDFTPD